MFAQRFPFHPKRQENKVDFLPAGILDYSIQEIRHIEPGRTHHLRDEGRSRHSRNRVHFKDESI